MIEALRNLYKNTFRFRGRTPSGEFWRIYLALGECVAILTPVGFALTWLVYPERAFRLGGRIVAGMELALAAVFLLAVIPLTSLNARRLRDTGRSPWMMLLFLVPAIGWIVWLLGVTDGSADDDDPKAWKTPGFGRPSEMCDWKIDNR